VVTNSVQSQLRVTLSSGAFRFDTSDLVLTQSKVQPAAGDSNDACVSVAAGSRLIRPSARKS
jgi:hypothetical protein